jgi:signal transduction histidine kinase
MRQASAQVPPERRLHRYSRGRLLGGVAAGLADHLSLPVVAVRVAFVALVFADGAGAIAYAAFWILLPQAEGRPVRQEESSQTVVLAVGASVLLVLLQLSGFGSGATIPLLAAAAGIALVWRQADDAQRARLRPGTPSLLLRSIGGVLLLAIGLGGFLASRGDLQAAREGMLSTVVVVGGLVLLGLPWVTRTLADLRVERHERIRVQERADLSAQVHDSVLQTLALIQRAADDPREVARLARSQERELRSWLYRPASAASFEAGLEQAAAEVEEQHGIRVEVVVVGGDVPTSEGLTALTAAAREAVVNAAKHAHVPLVEVYAEVEDDQVAVFVRDRGAGFDPDDVPADRYGLAESVVGRVTRAGGTATVRSAPGEGTEVALVLPR